MEGTVSPSLLTIALLTWFMTQMGVGRCQRLGQSCLWVRKDLSEAVRSTELGW